MRVLEEEKQPGGAVRALVATNEMLADTYGWVTASDPKEGVTNLVSVEPLTTTFDLKEHVSASHQ